MDRLAQQLAFLLEIDQLKEIRRQNYTIRGRRQETDAEHAWHVTMMAVLLAEHANTAVDLLRVVKMLLIHDLVEIDAGDTFAYDTAGAATQHEREARAADRLFPLLPADQAAAYRALWDEFEARTTAEAKYAHAMDRVLPIFLNNATEGAAWRRHGVTADRVLARNRHAAEGCAALWAEAEREIARAVAAGHLAPAKP
ncbi:MAG TPA: HD domain-containing protein [Opitutaceae bacterium]|jgi:putative hydrolase of HD superfamily|nr:HD domain-containing protein [Opitutaceae bacterium]